MYKTASILLTMLMFILPGTIYGQARSMIVLRHRKCDLMGLRFESSL